MGTLFDGYTATRFARRRRRGARPWDEMFPAERPALDGGGATRFTARLVNPPEQASSFSVTFATDS